MSDYQNTMFRLAVAALDPAFTGSPQEFIQEIVRLSRIVSPVGFYGIVVSDTEPSSNQGLWLKEGTKPYVWDENTSAYIPIDLTDSLTAIVALINALSAKLDAGRVVFSITEPGAADRAGVLWVKFSATDDGNPMELLKWSTTLSKWVRLSSQPIITGTAGGAASAYTLTNSPTLSSVPDLLIAVFKANHTNTGAATLNVDGLGAKSILKDGNAELDAGDITQGNPFVVVYDATDEHWHALTPIRPPHGVLVDKVPGTRSFTVPDGVYTIEVDCVGGGGGGGYSAGCKGGGGGGYSYKRWAVSPGDSIEYTVGAKGARSTVHGTPNDTDGGDTIFNTTQIAEGGTRGQDGGAGGSFSGSDYGFDGQDGTEAWATDKWKGGDSPWPGGFGGFFTDSSSWSPTDGVLGGGGAGDADAVSNDSSAGGDGVIRIKW